MPDRAVTAAHRRGEPGPGRQLAGAPEPGDVADLGQQDQRGERAHARQLGEHLDPGIGFGVLVQLLVEPVDRLLERVDHRQGVVDDLAGDNGQLESGQPPAARPAPAALRPPVTVIGQDRVDPVAQQCPEPDQLRPVPQHRPQLADGGRGDPRLRQQVGAQQLRQGRGVDLVFSELRNGGPDGTDVVAAQKAARDTQGQARVGPTSSNEEEAGEPFSIGCPLSVVPGPRSRHLRPADRDIPVSVMTAAMATQSSELR